MPDDELDRVPGAIALSEERVEGPARHPESTTQTDAAVLYECSAPGGIGVLHSARAKLAEEGAVTRARQAGIICQEAIPHGEHHLLSPPGHPCADLGRLGAASSGWDTEPAS